MRRIIYLAVVLLATTLNSCDLYERVEVDVVYTPLTDQEIIIPDWDENETQQ